MGNGLGKKPYCVGNGIHISLADLAVGCTLAWLDFRFPELDWRSPYPNLSSCCTGCKSGRASPHPSGLSAGRCAHARPGALPAKKTQRKAGSGGKKMPRRSRSE